MSFSSKAMRSAVVGTLLILLVVSVGVAEDAVPATAPASQPALDAWLPVGGDAASAGAMVRWLALVTVLSLAPAIAVMVTCFTRIVVVLGLLRAALATPNLPPNAILFALALLLSLVVMGPTLADVHADAFEPMVAGRASPAEALATAETSVRTFMIDQMTRAGTTDAVYALLPADLAGKENLDWADVSTARLIPAFVLGELKIAFLIGLRVVLPFVVIDLIVAAVLVSMGMLMLPPVLVAMPLKLLLFVLADGWTLVAGTLLAGMGAT